MERQWRWSLEEFHRQAELNFIEWKMFMRSRPTSCAIRKNRHLRDPSGSSEGGVKKRAMSWLPGSWEEPLLAESWSLLQAQPCSPCDSLATQKLSCSITSSPASGPSSQTTVFCTGRHRLARQVPLALLLGPAALLQVEPLTSHCAHTCCTPEGTSRAGTPRASWIMLAQISSGIWL